MKEVHPRIFRDADTLRPSDLRASVEHIENTLDELDRKRWVNSCFTLDWRDMDQSGPDGTNEGVFKVQPPSALGDWEIVGLEFRVAAASGDHTVTIADDGTTIDTLTVTATSATAFVLEQKSTSHVIQSGSEVVFTLTGYASVAVANAQLTVHIRSDRHQGSLPAARAFTQPSIIDGAGVDGSDYSDYLDNFDTDVTAHAANKTALRIEVLQVRNVGPSTNPDARVFDLPATKSKLHSFGAYLLQGNGSGTEETLFRVTDTDSATNYDVTLSAGADANTFSEDANTAVAATQSNDDPDDTNDHWTATIDSAGTSTEVPRAFLVLYWEE